MADAVHITVDRKVEKMAGTTGYIQPLQASIMPTPLPAGLQLLEVPLQHHYQGTEHTRHSLMMDSSDLSHGNSQCALIIKKEQGTMRGRVQE